MAPLYRGADGPNCKDIINGIAFSMPFCCILLDTAIFLVICCYLSLNLGVACISGQNSGSGIHSNIQTFINIKMVHNLKPRTQ